VPGEVAAGLAARETDETVAVLDGEVPAITDSPPATCWSEALLAECRRKLAAALKLVGVVIKPVDEFTVLLFNNIDEEPFTGEPALSRGDDLRRKSVTTVGAKRCSLISVSSSMDAERR
jgi:hypothetical protein